MSEYRSEVSIYSFGIVFLKGLVPGGNDSISLIVHFKLFTSLVLKSHGRFKANSVVVLSASRLGTSLVTDSHTHAVHHRSSLALNSRLVSTSSSNRVSKASFEIININLARGRVLNYTN